MEHPHELLFSLAEWLVLTVDVMAVVVAFTGSAVSFVLGARWLLSPDYAARMPIRRLWLWYARWLVAALTFLLAADIIETTLAPSYEDLVRLAAIAVIRTFLNYFLEKDLDEARESDALPANTDPRLRSDDDGKPAMS